MISAPNANPSAPRKKYRHESASSQRARLNATNSTASHAGTSHRSDSDADAVAHDLKPMLNELG